VGAAAPPTLPLPDKASIAVLPFANLSGDPEQEYFANGMVEEIITALSRIRWLFVIARNSSFTYKGQAVDVKQVGRELGVRYVLEGSVRKAGGRVRITPQLVDATNGIHLWADRFDGALDDIFELQDQVASSVAGVIEPALQAAETARSAHRPTNDLTAYDLYLRAYAMVLSSTRQSPEALRLLEQAIERDPRYGPALAWAAFCCLRLLRDGLSEHPAADRLKGTDLARRALEVAGDDPGILANAALALAYFGEDIGAMMALVDRALTLNPSFARGWYISGVIRAWAGQLDVAIGHVETALRLSPRARVGNSLAVIGSVHFFSGRFNEAAAKLLLAIQDSPSLTQPYRTLAACYAHMGRLDDARATIARLRALTPQVMPSVVPLRNLDHRELFLSGLRLAAGEATRAKPAALPRSSPPMWRVIRGCRATFARAFDKVDMRGGRLARRKRLETPAHVEIGHRRDRRVGPLAPRILHLNDIAGGYRRARGVGEVCTRELRSAEIGERQNAPRIGRFFDPLRRQQ
jgi:adenylate cyclase